MTKPVLRDFKPAERHSRARQRQKLIDACITALYQHGPSRTTIDKVVSIADMSPGIVNFYFETKAALLVAALEHLAVEFESAVLEPLEALRRTPVVALDRLIELYLDPQVASARKVSVWYSFWGESSSRREYFTICGKRDLAFAALVQDLVSRLIRQSNLAHLDADAVALGLIGCLEMMWQDIAFQEEAELDREAAKKRCKAYLRSVFPGHFSATSVPISGTVDLARALPASAYRSDKVLLAELAMFRGCWQFACVETDVSRAGEYVAWHSALDRSLVVRGKDLRIRGFLNTCLRRPHMLVAGDAGALGDEIKCTADGSRYGLDGIFLSKGPTGSLQVLDVAIRDGVVFASHNAEAAGTPPCMGVRVLAGAGDWRGFPVQADWKLVVEHWADAYFDTSARILKETSAAGNIVVSRDGVSRFWEPHEKLKRELQRLDADTPCLERRLIWPNIFMELWPDGASVRQVLPISPGRSHVRLRHYGRIRQDGQDWDSEDVRVIESTQAGLAWEDANPARGGATLREFLAWLRGAVADCYH